MAPTDDDDPDWDEDVEWRDRRRGREARTATSWQGGTGPMPTFVAIAALVVSLVAHAITHQYRPAQPRA
jgi:hypothetical protein